MTYSCTAPSNVTCSTTAEVSSWEDDNNLTLTSRDYAIIIAAYIIVCAIVNGLINRMAQKFSSHVLHKDASKFSMIGFIKGHLYDFFIAPVLEDDERTVRGFFEYFFTENELLNTFRLCCYPKPKSANKLRPFLYRLSVLVTGILITISIGQLFGSIQFDEQACSVTISKSYCESCSCDTYCGRTRYGCNADCTCKTESQLGFRCSVYQCVSGKITVDTSLTYSHSTNSCDSLSLGDSLLSTTSIITTILAQIIAYITSKMLETFIARSRPDMFLHMFNVFFAAGLVGIAYGISSQMMQESEDKSAALRMQTIAGITLYTYIQGQAYELVQIPMFYCVRFIFFGYFRSKIEEQKTSAVDPQEKSKDNGGAVVFPHQVEMEHIPAKKTTD